MLEMKVERSEFAEFGREDVDLADLAESLPDLLRKDLFSLRGGD